MAIIAPCATAEFNMAWYSEWFDTPFYHLLYRHRDENEAGQFIRALVAKLHLPPKANVLDVACGKGRHALVLSGLGLNVTGIDLSPNNIAEAKKYSRSNLHFEVSDMRTYLKPNHFDAVFNLFSSFGYFDNADEDMRALQNMYNNLRHGGLLVLDYLNTQHAVANLKPREIINQGDIQFHIQRSVENGYIIKKISFLYQGENYQYEERLRVINRLAFEEMFAACGLTIQHIFGDYTLQSFNPSKSPRLILVGKK
ncbi:MAG: methyltransferase domain-containing protein [Chitinophagales bacterium]|nr:methyltransferase domain-containing protein [Chitinophagales bacterium]MDW8418166.1 methyltransferase domain-containing protein [Chitinophagales bacterium]